MAIVRFDPDPDQTMPFGAGMFHTDDGRSQFGYDPELAQSLAQPDERTASFDDDLARLGKGFDQAAQFNRGEYASKLDAGSAGIVPEGSQTVPAKATEPHRVPDAGQPPAPTEQATPQQDIHPAQARANELQGNVDKYITRPVYDAPRAGGVVPTTQSQVIETSGAPYDPQGPQAMDRLAAHTAVQQAAANRADLESSRAAGEAAAWKAAQPELQRKAAEAERVQMAKRREYERERMHLDELIKQSEQSQSSFNANRFMQRAGVVGQIGAAIAQAFGAWSATIAGGPNMVAQQINGYIDQDIANQRAEIDAGKASANNQLAKLQRVYGDVDQAEAALRIAQQKVVDNMAMSYAAATKSEDVMAAAQQWIAENNQRYVLAEQAFENASYGKRSVTTGAKVVPSSAGGRRDPTEAEMQSRAKTLAARQGVVNQTYEGEVTRQKAEGLSPEKKDKLNEEVERYGKAVEGAKLNEATSSLANVEEKLRNYAGSADIPGIGPENVLTRANRAVDEYVVGPGEADKRFYTPEERSNRQAIQFLKADIRHALTGAGMSNEERRDLDNMIEGARTGDDFRNVVKIIKTRVNAHKSEIARGFSPDAIRLYESRGVEAPMPVRTIQR